MGKSTKRDNYRKIVTDLQNEIGIKKYNASKLMSQKDCIKAIYEVISIDLQNKERKEIDKHIETNRALNNINCAYIDISNTGEGWKYKIPDIPQVEFKIYEEDSIYCTGKLFYLKDFANWEKKE